MTGKHKLMSAAKGLQKALSLRFLLIADACSGRHIRAARVARGTPRRA